MSRSRSNAMRTGTRPKAALGLAAIAVVFALLCAPAFADEAPSPLPPSSYSVRALCPTPSLGQAACLALQLVPRGARARSHKHRLRVSPSTPSAAPSPAEGEFGLRPRDVHSAYRLPNETTTAQTIAVVDAYNDPTAAKPTWPPTTRNSGWENARPPTAASPRSTRRGEADNARRSRRARRNCRTPAKEAPKRGKKPKKPKAGASRCRSTSRRPARHAKAARSCWSSLTPRTTPISNRPSRRPSRSAPTRSRTPGAGRNAPAPDHP